MRCTPEKGEIGKKKNIQAGAELNQAQPKLRLKPGLKLTIDVEECEI